MIMKIICWCWLTAGSWIMFVVFLYQVSKHLTILHKWFVTTVLTQPTHVLQPHRILYGFSVTIQKQFFRVFQLFVQEVKQIHQKHTWKNSQIIFIWWKWFETWNNFGKKFASVRVEAGYIARTIFVIYSYLKSWVWLLLVAVTLPVTSASCEGNFSKNEISENISQKFHYQWKIG